MTKFLSDENAHGMSNIMISFLTWTTLYLIPYVRKTSERINKITPFAPRLKKQELGVKIVSIIHALYSTYGAYTSLNEIKGFSPDDILTIKSEWSSYYANVTAGFFIADLILCIILAEEYGPLFIVHAISALSGSLYVSMTGIGYYFFLNLLMYEASTPFLHIKHLLSDYGHGKTMISNINDLLFFLFFFYFRIIKGIPILLTMFYTLITKKTLPLPYTVFFIVFGSLMGSMNIYWFIKITKNAIKKMC